MTMKVRIGGDWKDIGAGKVFASGAWRTLVAIKVYFEGAWRDVANFTAPTPEAPGFTVTAPTSVRTVGTLSTIRSSAVTVTPSGGLAPYTYSWTAPGATIGTPHRASTTFTVNGMVYEDERELTAACVVADALGSTATVSISLIFQRV